MFICVEGPDGGGKTSLAKEICRQMDSHYMHLTYRWHKRVNQQIWYYYAAYAWMRKHSNRRHPSVLDRWWLSETVYANIFRDSSIAPNLWEAFNNVTIADKVLNVICLPKSVDTCVKRHGARLEVEMYDSVTDVYNLYHYWWRDNLKKQPNWIRYESDVMTIKEGASLVIGAYFQQLEYGINYDQARRS